MNTIAKENEINAYLEEWLISRFSEWNSFYFDVMRNKKNGVYQLKDGEKICNLLNSIQGNVEEHLAYSSVEHIIPSRFSSIDQLLQFLQNFRRYLVNERHWVEQNICGDSTSYIVYDTLKIMDDICCMTDRCCEVYLRKDGLSAPYQKMRELLHKNEIDAFMDLLKATIKSIPYDIRKVTFNEGHYHIIVHTIMSLIGLEPISEATTSDGRIDMVIKMPDRVFIFEFKYSDTDEDCSKDAINQIVKMKYADAYKLVDKEIVGVGVSFGQEKRNITHYNPIVLYKPMMIRSSNPQLRV